MSELKQPVSLESPNPVEAELEAIIGYLHGQLSQLNGEIAYVLRESTNDNISPDITADIKKSFESFWGTVQHDVRAEVFNLEDKLGLRRALESYDSGIKNSDPRVTMGFIRDWLGEDIVVLGNLVKALPPRSLAAILVTETAINMLNINMSVRDALDRIDAILIGQGK